MSHLFTMLTSRSSVRSSSNLQGFNRQHRREVAATFTLTTFLLSQWVLPQGFMLQSVQARPLAPDADAPSSLSSNSKPSTNGGAVKGKGSGKGKSLTQVDALPSDAPAWYRAERVKDQRRQAAINRERRVLLAQNPFGAGAKAAPVAANTAKVTGKTVGATSVIGSGWAETVSGPPLLHAPFPATLRASAPLAQPPLYTPLRLNLSNGYVPSEKEVVALGGLAGPLNPVAPADPQTFTAQVNQELQKEGFAQGLDTPTPTLAQAQAQQAQLPVARRAALNGLVVGAKRMEEARKRVTDARAQNREFAQALTRWNATDFKGAAQDLTGYVKKYPKSPWLPEALIHIANYAKFTGRGNDAEDLYRKVIDMTSNEPSDPSYNTHRKAFGRLTDLYLIEKRYGEVRPMLNDFLFNDTNWRRRTWGLYWLRYLDVVNADSKKRLASLDCGSQALVAMLAQSGYPHQARAIVGLHPKTERGFSLADLSNMAAKQGIKVVGFSATPDQLVHVPLPVILHYGSKISATAKTRGVGKQSTRAVTSAATSSATANTASYGHYVVVQKYDAKHKLWQILNPQDGNTTDLSSSELRREWSGRGLLVKKALPKLLTHPVNATGNQQVSHSIGRLSMAQMKRTFGTGYAVMGQSGIGCKSFNLAVRGDCCGIDGNGSHGEPAVSINPIDQNIYITDTPLWYKPAKGPPVNIETSYNSLDATNYSGIVGNKWSFNYGTYLAEIPDKAIIFMPDGAQLRFAAPTIPTPPPTTITYTSPRGIYSTLTQTYGTHHYVLTAPGGDTMVYDIPSGISTTIPVLVSKTDRFGQSLSLSYGVAGGKVVPLTITDADGKVTRLAYDTQGHLIYAQTPDERQASFSYDANGNLIQSIDAAGQAFQYAYDDTAVVSQLNTAQGAWRFSESFITYGNNNDGTIAYKDFKTTIADPSGSRPMVVNFHSPAHAVSEYTSVDHRGNVTTYEVTPPSNSDMARLTSIESPTGAKVSSSYDTSPTAMSILPTSVSSPSLNMSATYNSMGRPTQIVYSTPAGASRTEDFTYAANGVDLTGEVASGKTSPSATPITQTILQGATYDSNHLPTQVIDSLGHVTDLTYTSWGSPATIKVYEGTTTHTTTYSYGTTGYNTDRLVSVVEDGRTKATYDYDASGRVKQATDGLGLTTLVRYNNLDSPVAVKSYDGNSSLMDYTVGSLPGMMTDRSGRRTYYDYDALKRLVRVQDASGQTLQFSYDADGNRTGMIDANGHWTRWNYDVPNRTVSKIYSDGRSLTTHIANQGWVDYSVNARGTTISYTHDDFGDLSGVNYPTGSTTANLSFTYDALGRPSTMTDATGTTTWGYDSLGRRTTEDGPWAHDTLTYSYDDLNRVVGLNVDRDGTHSDIQTLTYDSLGRFDSLSATAGEWGSVGNFTYSYRGNTSQLSQFAMPNGITCQYSYESTGTGSLERFNGVQNLVTATSANLSTFGYSYDSIGAPTGFLDNRTGATRQYGTEGTQTLSYSYDPTSKLTGESGASGGTSTPGVSQAYSFDAMGNRTQFTNNVSQLRYDSAFNKLNQLTSLATYNIASTPATLTGSSTFDYDGDGNLTSENLFNASGTATGNVAYGYDDVSRLTSVTKPGVSKWEFVYDGMSRLRISRFSTWNAITSAWVLQQEKRRVYNGMNVVQERDDSNALTATLTRTSNMGGLLCRTTATGSSGRTFYGYDGGGNVTTLTDGSGTLVGSYTYDAWGNTLASSGSAASSNPYRYNTKEQFGDLYHYGYRFYSPSIGRWINRDPIGESGGVNIYGFSAGDPVNERDALGLSIGSFKDGFFSTFWGSFLEGAAIAAGLIALGITVPEALAAYFMFQFGYDIGSQLCQLMKTNFCSRDDFDYALGQMLGGIIGGLLGGILVGGVAGHGPIEPTEPTAGPTEPNCGEPGGGCFVADTPVLMADGSLKPIEKIRVGDRVLARDYDTGQTVGKKVEGVQVRHVLATLIVVLSNGERIETTKEHPFYVMGEGFVPAGRLAIGNSIVTRAGPRTREFHLVENASLSSTASIRIVALERHTKPTDVYNFTVQEFHTYFVGKTGAWVHNECPEGDFDLALGFETTLEKFADQHNAEFYEPGKYGEDMTDDEAVQNMILQLIQNATNIHFNVAGFDFGQVKNPITGGWLDPSELNPPTTNWEFAHIIEDENLFGKTTFYGVGGKVVEVEPGF